jgi:hypothetical protein
LSEQSEPSPAGGDSGGIDIEGSSRANACRGGVRHFLRERRRYWIVPITIMGAVFVIFYSSPRARSWCPWFVTSSDVMAVKPRVV